MSDHRNAGGHRLEHRAAKCLTANGQADKYVSVCHRQLRTGYVASEGKVGRKPASLLQLDHEVRDGSDDDE